MSATADLQDAVTAVLKMTGRVRAEIEILSRRTKERAKDIEAAVAQKSGLCIFVMPPFPTRATQGGPFVFIEAATIRVRIVERPAVSAHFGTDAYAIMDDVMQALQQEPHRSLVAARNARLVSQSINPSTATQEEKDDASDWVAEQPENAALVAMAQVLTAGPMYLQPTPLALFLDQPELRALDVLFEAPYGFESP